MNLHDMLNHYCYLTDIGFEILYSGFDIYNGEKITPIHYEILNKINDRLVPIFNLWFRPSSIRDDEFKLSIIQKNCIEKLIEINAIKTIIITEEMKNKLISLQALI